MVDTRTRVQDWKFQKTVDGCSRALGYHGQGQESQELEREVRDSRSANLMLSVTWEGQLSSAQERELTTGIYCALGVVCTTYFSVTKPYLKEYATVPSMKTPAFKLSNPYSRIFETSD